MVMDARASHIALQNMTKQQHDHLLFSEAIESELRDLTYDSFGSDRESYRQVALENVRQEHSEPSYKNYIEVESLKRSMTDEQITDHFLTKEAQSLKAERAERWRVKPESVDVDQKWKSGVAHKGMYMITSMLGNLSEYAEEKRKEVKLFGAERSDAEKLNPVSNREIQARRGTGFAVFSELAVPVVVGVAIAGSLGGGLAVGAAFFLADKASGKSVAKNAVAFIAEAVSFTASGAKIGVQAIDKGLDMVVAKLNKKRQEKSAMSMPLENESKNKATTQKPH